ncbi:MAG TPA: allantoinase [Acidobacteriota bacterium]|nr:allantoinase [Acidobacteriota bacterium]
MPDYDLLIRNATIVSPSGAERGDLAVADEKIAARGPNLTGSAADIIDGAGLHLFPGVIDPHVHFNEPGRTDWEGFSTGSQALVAGGGTLFLDMPLNSSPPTIDAAGFHLKARLGQRNSVADFALWGGLVPSNLDRLEELHVCGVVGFKAFMSETGIDDFPCVDDATLYEGMKRAALFPSLVAVHAENNSITKTRALQAIAGGDLSIRDYLDSRPVVAELEAIRRAILFAADTGCPLHIVHVSTGRGIQAVVEARGKGIDVSCETCPHYLLFTEEDLERLGAVAKCAPPLRSPEHRDDLWRCLQDGLIDMVASDHSPGLPAMKTGNNFFSIWGGVSGCQSLLSALISEGAQKRKIPLSLLSALTSQNPARRFRLTPAKGSLDPGADADLTLISLNSAHILSPEDLFYRHRRSPYTGCKFGCRILRTIIRGNTVYLDRKITSAPKGRLIRPGVN